MRRKIIFESTLMPPEAVGPNCFICVKPTHKLLQQTWHPNRRRHQESQTVWINETISESKWNWLNRCCWFRTDLQQKKIRCRMKKNTRVNTVAKARLHMNGENEENNMQNTHHADWCRSKRLHSGRQSPVTSLSRHTRHVRRRCDGTAFV